MGWLTQTVPSKVPSKEGDDVHDWLEAEVRDRPTSERVSGWKCGKCGAEVSRPGGMPPAKARFRREGGDIMTCGEICCMAVLEE